MTDVAEMADWQRGIALSSLRAVSSVFAEHDGDLPLSPFTAFRERDVANWLGDPAGAGSAGRTLDLAGDRVGEGDRMEITSVVASELVARRRVLRDFAGRAIGRLEVGDRYVHRMACRPGREALLRSRIEALRTDGALWVSGWVEHPGDRALAKALGLRLAGTKVRASSELIALWTSGGVVPIPYAEVVALCRLTLGLPPATIEAAREEAEGVGDFAQHYSTYNERGSWQALSLRGYGPAGEAPSPTTILKPAEMSRAWKKANEEALEWSCSDTPLRDQLPACRELEDLVPGEKQRVRLMRLEPGGGELTRHADITDPEAGTAPGRLLRVHIPLRTNPDVRFRMWGLDGRIEEANMEVGTAWYLDTRKPHTAINGGTEPRIHLVADVFSSPELLDRLGARAEIVS